MDKFYLDVLYHDNGTCDDCKKEGPIRRIESDNVFFCKDCWKVFSLEVFRNDETVIDSFDAKKSSIYFS